MNIWVQLLAGFCTLAWFVVWLLYFHRKGYQLGLKQGDQQGYKRGRIDADNCWIAQDIEIEAARQKLWQEES